MNRIFIFLLKIILVIPASIAAYGLFNLLGFLFIWIIQWFQNHIFLWIGTRSDVNLVEFLTASDFSGAGYLGGFWYLFWIRLPGSIAFFMVPILMFNKRPKAAFWFFVVLFIIAVIVLIVLSSAVIDRFPIDNILRGSIELLVIPVLAIIYVYHESIKNL